VSYDDTLATDLDRARSLIGDTTDPELHSDEHIDAVLTAQGSLGLAVSYLAWELVMRFANDPIKFTDVGGSYDYSHRIALWQVLAAPYQASLVTDATPSSVSASPFSSVSVTYTGATDTDEYSRPWWAA
jgi:hypothetical protein